jgi:uncharacterized protein (TIGR02466 family)
MTVQSDITSIFPTPIYRSELNRNLSKEELSFIDKTKKDVYAYEGNTTLTSNDNYILENKVFKNLKKDLYLRVQDYSNKIISPANNISPYITQSWLNYTETNQYQNRHVHYNSLISGVFYINCHEEYDKIKFFKKDAYEIIKPEVKDWNLYNSETWWFTVKTGDIILFPSSLSHMVETKQGDNTRISLAFNVFVKGEVGSYKNLTYLKLM